MHCPQDVAAFLLSPEARDLRPLLLREIIDGMDLLARDQVRRAYSRCHFLLITPCYSVVMMSFGSLTEVGSDKWQNFPNRTGVQPAQHWCVLSD